jgi:hypothetical protein
VREVSSVEFVMVPVPADRVLDVYAFLGDPKGSGPGESVGEKKSDDWSAQLVERVVRASSVPSRQFQYFLADHSNEWIDTHTVAAQLGLERSSFPGYLASIEQRARKLGFEAGAKPFEAEWRVDRAYYRMSPDVAEAVRRVRANLGG